jgi:hypothetical protein
VRLVSTPPASFDSKVLMKRGKFICTITLAMRETRNVYKIWTEKYTENRSDRKRRCTSTMEDNIKNIRGLQCEEMNSTGHSGTNRTGNSLTGKMTINHSRKSASQSVSRLITSVVNTVMNLCVP